MFVGVGGRSRRKRGETDLVGCAGYDPLASLETRADQRAVPARAADLDCAFLESLPFGLHVHDGPAVLLQHSRGWNHHALQLLSSADRDPRGHADLEEAVVKSLQKYVEIDEPEVEDEMEMLTAESLAQTVAEDLGQVVGEPEGGAEGEDFETDSDLETEVEVPAKEAADEGTSEEK